MSSYYEKILATGEVKCIDEEVPFEIPTSWSWARLASITSILGDGIHGTPEYDVTGTVYFINGNNLSNGSIEIKADTKKVSEQEAEKHKRLLNSTTVLVSINGTLGNVAFYNGENVILGKSACYFNLMGNIDKQYIKHILETEYFTEYAKNVATGSTIKNVPLAGMRNFLIPVPPITEQHRIILGMVRLAHSIVRYNDAQTKLDLLNNVLNEKLKKSVLQEAIQGKLVPQLAEEGTAQELLEQIKAEKEKLVKEGKLKKSALNDSIIFRGDDNKYYEKVGKTIECIDESIPFEIPRSWAFTRLGYIGDWGSGSTPAKGNSSYYGGDILWLRTGELNDSIVYDTEIKITSKALAECSFRLNQPGDVLIAMYGATIGKLAIVGTSMTTNQACCGCTPIIVYNKYLFYYLMAVKDLLVKKGEGGAQPNISREKIVKFIFAMPPLKEQYRIVNQIELVLDKLS